MKRITKIFLTSALSITLLCSGAFAATHQKEEEGQKSGSQMQSQSGESIKWAKNAKEILDKKIVSPDGKELGKADDIVIGTDGSIEYIVLKSSGSEKLKQGEYAVPWDAVKSDAKVDTLVAEMDQMEIEKYTKEKKEKEKQQKQQAKQQQSQQQQGMKTAEGEQVQAQQQQGMKTAEGQQKQQKQGKEIAELQPKRARDVMGKKVMSKNEEELGTADNIYISDDGKALFVIVQSKDDNQMRPIPADMVHKDPKGDNLKVEVEKEKFAQAPGFEQGKKPELAKSKWEQEIRGYYGEQDQQSGSGQMKKEQEMEKKQSESKMEEKSSQTQ